VKYYDKYGQEVEPEKNKHSIGQVFVAVATIAVAIVGAKVPEFEWFLYLCIPLLIILLTVMLFETKLGSYIKNVWHVKKDNKILKDEYAKYIEIFDKSETAEKLISSINKIDWGNIRPAQYLHLGNKHNRLKQMLETSNTSASSMLILLNYSLQEYIDYADGYLNHCDNYIINREVNYLNPLHKAETVKLIRRYEDFRDSHDEYCKSINLRLHNIKLLHFYGKELCFIPKEISVANEAQA